MDIKLQMKTGEKQSLMGLDVMSPVYSPATAETDQA
jgi:hypothetical protein